MKWVFTNIFQNRTEHARQRNSARRTWKFGEGLRWKLWMQRHRSKRAAGKIKRLSLLNGPDHE